MAGEGHNDMPDDVSKAAYDNNSTAYNDFEPGEHYLRLSKTERDMVNMVCENFSNIIVLYNGANPLELGFVDSYPQIKSVIWCPGPGNVGFNALGKIMCGEINPSGKTADTFVYDMKAAPWWNNWVIRNYENLADMAVDSMNSGRPQRYAPSFINYVESIYVGYKFYETAATEGLIDYEKTVQYPFGYGQSYTTFTQKMGPLSENKGVISFDVTVTNTGAVPGKDVVEVYINPPYKNGGIEKASANLAAFAKTKLLEGGESQTLTLTIKIEDLTSYDAKGAKAYVLENGDYIISINSDSHTILDKQIYTVDATVVYNGNNNRPGDHVTAINLFDDVKGEVIYLSRKDGFANFETAIAPPDFLVMPDKYVAGYHLNANFDYSTYINSDDVMPTTGARNGLLLADLRGTGYDDLRWDALLDQMSVSEMSHLIALAGYQTVAVESVGKKATVDCDGPASINNNFTGAGSIGFPVAVVIASTWNQELAREYGECMGKMCKEMNVAGWYAPAINTHRVSFGGRNFEYYSEDGVLAGKISAAAVTGAMKEGVYSYIKHFALYDSNGKMVCIWADEQAMREIYLKPFEISVKDGKANALMVSWNFLGNKWVGECDNLMNTLLRNEWGFRGMAITDFFRNNGHGFMNADMALANGVDAMLSTYAGGPNNVTDPNAPSSVIYMRRASKNIMYTVVNSWVYDDASLQNGMLPWQKIALGIDILLGILVIATAVFIYQKSRKIEA
jgi:beta-glucosidase